MERLKSPNLKFARLFLPVVSMLSFSACEMLISNVGTNNNGSLGSEDSAPILNLPLSLSIDEPSLEYGSSVAYTVSGGSGDYQVSVDSGSIDNPSGSGFYLAEGANAVVTINVYDRGTANSATQDISIVCGDLCSWMALSPTGTAPSAIAGHSAVLIQDKMYTFGAANNFWVFDPAASSGEGSWTQLSPTGTAPSSVNLPPVVIQDKMYVFGVGNGYWVFDPEASSGAGSWTQGNSTGAAAGSRSLATTVVIQDKVYSFGGSYMNDLRVFDPAASGGDGSWTLLTPSGTPPKGRSGHVAVELDGKMYVFGGIDEDSSYETPENNLHDMFVYDPVLNSWADSTPFRATVGQSAVVIEGKIYAFGGQIVDSEDITNEVNFFDPNDETWSLFNPVGIDIETKFEHSAIVINDKMYVFGGNVYDDDLGYYVPTNAIIKFTP
jgi:hypothetical protein